MMLLSKELEKLGLEMDPGQFEDVLQETRHRLFRGMTLEDLLNRPIECGAQFVRAVRKEVSKSLPEEFIMRRLQNIRKGKRLVTAGT